MSLGELSIWLSLKAAPSTLAMAKNPSIKSYQAKKVHKVMRFLFMHDFFSENLGEEMGSNRRQKKFLSSKKTYKST